MQSARAACQIAMRSARAACQIAMRSARAVYQIAMQIAEGHLKNEELSIEAYVKHLFLILSSFKCVGYGTFDCK